MMKLPGLSTCLEITDRSKTPPEHKLVLLGNAKDRMFRDACVLLNALNIKGIRKKNIDDAVKALTRRSKKK